jgi:hypothetical protein
MPEGFFPQTLEGALAVLSRIIIAAFSAWALVMSAVKRMVKDERLAREAAIMSEREAREEALTSESEDRELADRRIEERMQDIAQKLHNYMGKLDIVQESIHKAELDRVREMGALREELRTGFASIQGMLRQAQRRQNGDST